jgi:hypothetical protein
MKGFNGTKWALGLIVVAMLCGMSQTLAAQDSRLVFSVQINNYAGIDSNTLVDAEKFASAIFRKSGVGTRWITALGPSGEKLEEISGPESIILTNLRVSVLPRVMADRFGMRDKVLGLAPGSGANRQQIYVFYSKVEALAQSPESRFFAGPHYFQVTKALILGHAISHEIGHLLLNLEIHTATGIMRGNWTMNDLLDAASGRLVFSTQQDEVIRTEVARRMGKQKQMKTAGIEIAKTADDGAPSRSDLN